MSVDRWKPEARVFVEAVRRGDKRADGSAGGGRKDPAGADRLEAAVAAVLAAGAEGTVGGLRAVPGGVSVVTDAGEKWMVADRGRCTRLLPRGATIEPPLRTSHEAETWLRRQRGIKGVVLNVFDRAGGWEIETAEKGTWLVAPDGKTMPKEIRR